MCRPAGAERRLRPHPFHPSRIARGEFIMRVRTAVFLLGVALAGCGGGGERPAASDADEVKPDLGRVTIEVKGMT
jgi:hypothetical protein